MPCADGSHFTARAPRAFAASSRSSASGAYGWTEAAHSNTSGCRAARSAAYASGTWNVERSRTGAPVSSRAQSKARSSVRKPGAIASHWLSRRSTTLSSTRPGESCAQPAFM